jgi:hypothetical protein
VSPRWLHERIAGFQFQSQRHRGIEENRRLLTVAHFIRRLQAPLRSRLELAIATGSAIISLGGALVGRGGGPGVRQARMAAEKIYRVGGLAQV